MSVLGASDQSLKEIVFVCCDVDIKLNLIPVIQSVIVQLITTKF